MELWFEPQEYETYVEFLRKAGVSEDVIKGGSDVINLINGLPANQGYDSFRKLKNAIGSPGEGNHWHHIVEQSQIGKSGFNAKMTLDVWKKQGYLQIYPKKEK